MPYDLAMATVSPSETPNPNATKYTLDVTLPATINFSNAEAAAGNPFAAEVFTCDGVASIFGVKDFVTVTRKAGADWDPIHAAVEAAAATHL
ncbi:MAG: Scaffold protein Nfu/NifU terminal [Actinomycetota bacterium]|nr:Scaffold protein Nfu/NifU terminal [Actinomycetota bacterium]